MCVAAMKLSQLFIDKGENSGCNGDDDECSDRPPHGVGLGKLPDSENAKDGADYERNRDHHERDPSDELWIDDAFGLSFRFFQFDGNICLGLHPAIIAN